MNFCPACHAKTYGNRVCRRCGNDLAPLIAIAEEAERHRQDAVSAFQEGDYQRMHFHAKRAWSLKRDAEHGRFLACSALLAEQYPLALSQWRVNSDKRAEQ